MITGFPEETRASYISRQFWCAEVSRLKATLKEPRGIGRRTRKSELGGLSIHDRLERRKFPSEVEKLLRLIAANQPWYGVFEGTKIFIHPDEYRVKWTIPKLWYEVSKKTVTFVENKTSKGKPGIYQTCQSTFQTKTYVFVGFQTLPLLGYEVARKHRIMYWRRPSVRIKKLILLKVVPVNYDPVDYEKDLHYIFEVWRGNEKPVAPAKWKCGQCDPYYKVRCRFYTGEIPLSRKDWNERFAGRKR